MKHNTAKLEGENLNIAVALADGWEVWDRLHDKRAIFDKAKDRTARAIYLTDGKQDERWPQFNPSTSWAEGGPIIERERIALEGRDRNGNPSEWVARGAKLPLHFGPTPLIAAMRCFVASKLGDEVEI